MRSDPGRPGRLCGILLAFSLACLLLRPGTAEAGDLNVVISEIHYHPVEAEEGDEGDEFMELQNLSDAAVDISGWFLEGGVAYAFPDGTFIPSRGFVVIGRDASRLMADYELSKVYGNFVGKLSNTGEKITLRDRAGNLVDRIDYRDDAPWPENPDGSGPSLEKQKLTLSGEDQMSWRASIPLGGTPGEPNSTTVERTSLSLIAMGDVWKYRKGTSEPATPVGTWAATGFNDSSWSSGPGGFGYGDGDDATVLSDMEDHYTTVYLRKKFTAPALDTVSSVILSIVYDDAYVAYLNGTEIRRSATAGGTRGTPLAYNARAADTHENVDGDDSLDLKALGDLLHQGENVLAIQALNESSSSSDLTLIACVAAVIPAAPPPMMEPAHDLEINEVFAGNGDEEGFIEIHNEGAEEADLSGYQLVHSAVGTGGYVFAEGTRLAAGAWLIVPASSLPFVLSDAAQWFGLVTPDLRFVDGVQARARPPGASWGRYPDGDGDTFVLAGPTPGGPNTVSLEDSIVINEVQYHPPLSASTAEYIELYNRGSRVVDASLWRLDGAVTYALPYSATIPAGGYLVVSGDPAAIAARYGISPVFGPWSGRLSNGAEKIELKDALGNRVDVVHYADDGRWPASTATAGPDGFGPSVELVNPGMENNHGSSWLASTGMGTPGARNSRYAADPPPVIRSVEHSPPAPLSTEEVTVTARVSDDRCVGSVTLFSRPDGSGTFSQQSMLDDGLHGDGAAGDGNYGARLPGRPDGTIVQLSLEATDTTGSTRRFPAGAPAQVCLYQVDDAEYPDGVPLYRAVLRQVDLTELVNRDLDSDVLLDGTFVHGKNVTYNVGIRYRGEHSRNFWVKSFKIQFTDDEGFEDVTDLNLNAVSNTMSHLAADFFRRADMPVFQTAPVAYTLNKSWEARHGGIYLRVEAVDGDFLARQFDGDDGGNLYRGRDAGGGDQGDLSYKGSSSSQYVDIYEKKTNEDLNDYSDIIQLTNAFTNASDASFAGAISQLIDVQQWMRYFAVQSVLNNKDGCISTNVGEDYFIYHRPSDGKWVLIPWDQNEDFQDPTDGIFRQSVDAVARLLEHPDIQPLYHENLRQLLDGPFQQEVMKRQGDSVSFVLAQAWLDWVEVFVPRRDAAIRPLLPAPQEMSFVRGDSNADGTVDISDGLKVLLYLFSDGITPRCLDALDADDSGTINLTDAIHILDFLFQGGPNPRPPFPAAGKDPTGGDPYICTEL